jgi:hypothetical protein
VTTDSIANENEPTDNTCPAVGDPSTYLADKFACFDGAANSITADLYMEGSGAVYTAFMDEATEYGLSVSRDGVDNDDTRSFYGYQIGAAMMVTEQEGAMATVVSASLVVAAALAF